MCFPPFSHALSCPTEFSEEFIHVAGPKFGGRAPDKIPAQRVVNGQVCRQRFHSIDSPGSAAGGVRWPPLPFLFSPLLALRTGAPHPFLLQESTRSIAQLPADLSDAFAREAIPASQHDVGRGWQFTFQSLLFRRIQFPVMIAAGPKHAALVEKLVDTRPVQPKPFGCNQPRHPLLHV